MSPETAATTTNGVGAARKITLRSSDGEEFSVDEAVAMESQIVRGYFEEKSSDDPSNNVMTLPSVAAKNLAKIVEYCAGRVGLRGEGATEEEMEFYNAKFLKGKDDEAVKELLVASNFLDVKDLEDLLCEAVADRIRNKSVEFVRAFFGVESDFTPEEEAAKRRENEWAFEGVDRDS